MLTCDPRNAETERSLTISIISLEISLFALPLVCKSRWIWKIIRKYILSFSRKNSWKLCRKGMAWSQYATLVSNARFWSVMLTKLPKSFSRSYPRASLKLIKSKPKDTAKYGIMSSSTNLIGKIPNTLFTWESFTSNRPGGGGCFQIWKLSCSWNISWYRWKTYNLCSNSQKNDLLNFWQCFSSGFCNYVQGNDSALKDLL